MAESRRANRHIHETCSLGYGHLGTASYDERNRDWSFLRQHPARADSAANEGHIIRQTAADFQLVDERIFNFRTDASNPSSAVKSHATNAKGLRNLFLNNIPDAAFARTDSQTSAYNLELPHDAPTQKRPLASALALGHARPAFESGMHNNAPATAIVAVPAGSHSGTLLLFGFEACQVAIRSDSGLHGLYPLPSIGKAAIGQWCESGDAILQVSSATQEKGTQFLVVKPSGTTILRPMSVAAAPGVLVQSKSTARFTSENRLLDPCPAATITSSRTGGSPHAHSAFNPNDHNMVAIVDISGQWSTWKLTGSRARSARILHQVHLQGSNNLLLTDQHPSFKPGTLQGDEWHRISWLASPGDNTDRVLVCNRRVAAVYDQKGDLLGQVDMRLGPQSDRNAILDIKNSNRQRGHLFVLTTSRLLLFSSTEGSRRKRNPVEPLELVSSWNHFRDRADFGLRMSILESPQDSWILVYSTAGRFAVKYHFGYESSNSNVVSLEDPSIFHLPQRLNDRIEDISDIVLCPVKFSTQSQPFDAVHYGLVKLIARTNDGGIIEALYKHALSQSSPAGQRSEYLPVLSLPGISGTVPRSAKYIDDDDLDDFVVSKPTEGEHFPGPENAVSNRPEDFKPPAFGIRNWQRLLEHLGSKEEGHEEITWSAALQQAVEGFEHLQGHHGAMTSHLISDLVNDCSIMDVERDSRDLESWLDGLTVRTDVCFECVSFPKTPTDSAHHRLLSYYNSLVAIFLQPLSDQLTDRNRVNRERLVRQIVGPAVFGTLRLSTTQSIAPPKTPHPLAISELAVPYPSPGPDSDDQCLSQSSAPESSVAGEEQAVARLRQYVDFRHQVPPLLLDPNTGTSIVSSHLPASIQEDPIEYSYQQTNQRMKLVQEQHAAESLDPKQRKKALKSAARLQRKLERNQVMGQEAMLQRMLVPSIGPGTEVPALPRREVQSSQAAAPGSSQLHSDGQTALPGMTMTQPERGAFGTRHEAKKVKKRRVGF